MSNLTLTFDKTANDAIEMLKNHYGTTSTAEIIRKALSLLKVAAEVDLTEGELIARKGDKETKIIVS